MEKTNEITKPSFAADDMPNFAGAIFDLDGTLLNSMFLWKQIDHDFLLLRGIEVPDGYLQAIAHMGAVRTADYTIELFGLDEKPEEMIAEWTKMAMDFYANKVELKSGATEYLEYLKSRGVKLAVATANDECLYMPALVHTDILKYFDAVVSVNDVSRGKGFPDVYELAASKIGLSPSECVVFEDVLTAVNGARDGGFRVIGVYDETSNSDKEDMKRLTERFVCGFDELMGQVTV